MPPLFLREPVSVATHALGLVAALPTTWLLIRGALRRPGLGEDSAAFERGKAVSLGIFGFGMVACYGASVLYHAWPGDERTLDLLRRLDMVGIFLLIAGTFTPAAWALMRPRPRRVAMAVVWGVSIVSATAVVVGRSFPTWLATSLYLGLGWGMLLCYAEVRRDHDRRTLQLLPIGGALYSAGAVVNLTRAAIAPGLGAHEIFHLFVLAGTAAHVAFLFRVAVPAREPRPRAALPRASPARPRRRDRAGIDA